MTDRQTDGTNHLTLAHAHDNYTDMISASLNFCTAVYELMVYILNIGSL